MDWRKYKLHIAAMLLVGIITFGLMGANRKPEEPPPVPDAQVSPLEKSFLAAKQRKCTGHDFGR